MRVLAEAGGKLLALALLRKATLSATSAELMAKASTVTAWAYHRYHGIRESCACVRMTFDTVVAAGEIKASRYVGTSDGVAGGALYSCII